MVLRVPNCPFLILILAHLFLLSSHVFAIPPSEDSPVLAPRLQKELGKALEALRADKPAQARSHLEVLPLVRDFAEIRAWKNAF